MWLRVWRITFFYLGCQVSEFTQLYTVSQLPSHDFTSTVTSAPLIFLSSLPQLDWEWRTVSLPLCEQWVWMLKASWSHFSWSLVFKSPIRNWKGKRKTECNPQCTDNLSLLSFKQTHVSHIAYSKQPLHLKQQGCQKPAIRESNLLGHWFLCSSE